MDEFLELEPTEPVNNKLEAVGFETRQFINNVGSFFLFMLLCALGVTCWSIAAAFSRKYRRANRLRKKLSRMLFWNRLNQAVFESILIVSFCSFITFKYKWSFESWGQAIQSLTSMFSLAVYASILVFTMTKLLCNYEIRLQKQFARQFRSLYEGLAHHNGKIVMLEPICFLIRRFMLATLIIFGTDVFIYQMATLI